MESLNGRLRDELLNETLFRSLPHARAMLAAWRTDYNEVRPHSRLGWMTPASCAETTHPRRAPALRIRDGFAPAPVAHPARAGQTHSQTPLRAERKAGATSDAIASSVNQTVRLPRSRKLAS